MAEKYDDLDWVRVTDKDTGIRRSVRAVELNHGNYTVLKQDAIDPVSGDVVPPEYPDDSPQTAATTGQTATQQKEN